MNRPKATMSPWVGAVVFVVLMALAGSCYYFFGRTTHKVPMHSLPVPTSVTVQPLTPTVHPAAPRSSSTAPAKKPTKVASTTTRSPKSKAAPSVNIPPGVPTQIYVPAFGGASALSAQVFKMPTPCQQNIVPPETGDVFSCTDFALPGTSSASKAVLTGHSSPFQPTELNKLNAMAKQGNLVGHSVFVKTSTSGSHWLQYVITNVHHVVKAKLPYDATTWGAPGQSTAGRLVIVTCLPINVVPAHDNFVVVAQLKGVGK